MLCTTCYELLMRRRNQRV